MRLKGIHPGLTCGSFELLWVKPRALKGYSRNDAQSEYTPPELCAEEAGENDIGDYLLVCPFTKEHCTWRAEEDFQVEPERPRPRVPNVEADHLVEFHTAAAVHLP